MPFYFYRPLLFFFFKNLKLNTSVASNILSFFVLEIENSCLSFFGSFLGYGCGVCNFAI